MLWVEEMFLINFMSEPDSSVCCVLYHDIYVSISVYLYVFVSILCIFGIFPCSVLITSFDTVCQMLITYH